MYRPLATSTCLSSWCQRFHLQDRARRFPFVSSLTDCYKLPFSLESSSGSSAEQLDLICRRLQAAHRAPTQISKVPAIKAKRSVFIAFFFSPPFAPKILATRLVLLALLLLPDCCWPKCGPHYLEQSKFLWTPPIAPLTSASSEKSSPFPHRLIRPILFRRTRTGQRVTSDREFQVRVTGCSVFSGYSECSPAGPSWFRQLLFSFSDLFSRVWLSPKWRLAAVSRQPQ